MSPKHKNMFEAIMLRRIQCEHENHVDFGLLCDHEDNLQIILKSGGFPTEEFSNLAFLAVSWVYGVIGLKYINEAEELLKNEDSEGLAQFLIDHNIDVDDSVFGGG